MSIRLFATAAAVLLIQSTAAFAQNACPAINVPPSFEAREKFFAIGTDLDLKASSGRFGKVVQRTLHLTNTFDIQNASGETVARAHEKLFSWGTQIVVEDCAGNRIGTVKEEVLKSFFKTWTSYKLLDAGGNQIATSEKLELLATNIKIHRNDGAPVGTMHRPFINLLTDKWDVTYNQASGIDPRLWLAVPAYKTAVDNQRRAEEARKRRDEDRSRSSSRDDESRDSKSIATLEQPSGGTQAQSGSIQL